MSKKTTAQHRTFPVSFFGRSTSLTAPRWVLSGPTGGHGHDDVEPRQRSEPSWLSWLSWLGSRWPNNWSRGRASPRPRDSSSKDWRMIACETFSWSWTSWRTVGDLSGSNSKLGSLPSSDRRNICESLNKSERSQSFATKYNIIIYNKYTDFSQRWRIWGMRPNISNISICIVWGTWQEQTASYADYTWLKCHRLLDRTKVSFGVELVSFWCWSYEVPSKSIHKSIHKSSISPKIEHFVGERKSTFQENSPNVMEKILMTWGTTLAGSLQGLQEHLLCRGPQLATRWIHTWLFWIFQKCTSIRWLTIVTVLTLDSLLDWYIYIIIYI